MRYFFYLFCFVFCLFFSACQEEKTVEETQPTEQPEPEKKYEYGFDLSQYNVVKDTVKQGDTFGKILNNNNVTPTDIYNIVQKSQELLPPKDFQINKPYALIFRKNMPDSLAYFIYEPSVSQFIKVSTRDSVYAEKINRKITFQEKQGGGLISSNLIQDVMDAGMSFSAAHKLSQIFDYTIDFFHLQKDDKFKIIYKERYVDDTIYAGLESVDAAYFEHKGRAFYAFNFQADSTKNKNAYYDEKGNTMKRMFLKAPLDIFRITSRFGVRFHPVLHRMKGHFGTDYAAPTGTPIRATANGTVTRAGYAGGNGNYVKIRHNGTYETQYLHMSKILVKQGQYVSQGDIIGKVGSTGLATGPHVCYRFWKNGVQVDPLKEILPEAEPIDAKLKERYLLYIQPLKQQLDEMPYTHIETHEQEPILNEKPQDSLNGNS